MNEVMPIGPRGCAAIFRVPTPAQGHQQACTDQRTQGDQEAPVSMAAAVPILHFASGGTSPERVQILRSFNEDRNYAAIEPMLEDPPRPLQRFQGFNLRWILAMLNKSPAVAYWKYKAWPYAATPAKKAAYFENIAFELIMVGNLAEAKENCRAALQTYPTSQGLWINLMVAMTWLNEHELVELLLLELPRVVNVDQGLLGVYLHEEPELQRPVCNGG